MLVGLGVKVALGDEVGVSAGKKVLETTAVDVGQCMTAMGCPLSAGVCTEAGERLTLAPGWPYKDNTHHMLIVAHPEQPIR